MLAVYKSHIMFSIHTHVTDMPALPRTAACFVGPVTPLLLCGVAGLLACSGSETKARSDRAERLGLDSAAFEAKFAQPAVAFPLPDSVRLTASSPSTAVAAQGGVPTPDAAGTAATPGTRDRSAIAAGVAKVRTPKSDLDKVTSARSDSIAKAMVARMASSAGNTESRSDSVRGIVTLAGTAPAVSVGLRPVAGGAPIQLGGMATSSLARLGGATVTARGMRITVRDFVVAEFFVRAVNGAPVLDGVLESAEGGWWLRPTDGSPRMRLSDVPSSVRGLSGSRVWIAAETTPNAPRAAGVIGRR